jgi:hypothetical protein
MSAYCVLGQKFRLDFSRPPIFSAACAAILPASGERTLP